MYIFNDNKVYADLADGQYIVLNHVSGEYYAFDKASSAVLEALTSGCGREDVAKALAERFGEGCGADEKLSAFIDSLLAAEMLLPEGASGQDAAPFAEKIEGESLPELGFERFTDVADLLMMDPIHEVDEDMGWPIPKE